MFKHGGDSVSAGEGGGGGGGGGANFQVVDYSFSEFWSNCFVLSVLSNKQT